MKKIKEEKPKKVKIKKEVEETDEKKITLNLIELLVILVITSLSAAVISGSIVYNNINKENKTTTKTETNYLDEIEKTYKNILGSYVEKVDEKELVNSAIKGMYGYLGDPYTEYLDETTTEDLNDRLDGEYYGIGVEITKREEGVVVVTVFNDSPASNAGIEVGDIIVKVNDKDVAESDADEISNLIKADGASNIEISVNRGGITKTLTVERKNVYIPSVTSQKYDNVGYIYISTFSNTTYTQFKKALESLEKDGIKSLLIDVRSNGGGYLNSAVDIASLFIEKGKNLYGLENKNNTKYYKDETSENRNYKVGVLINGSSASASEILAAALKESYGATLIGTKSYGKGTVQETEKLDSGGMVKYTTAYWLTPNGNKINKVGLNPDIEIDGEFYEGLEDESDTQLISAIKAFK